MQLVSSHLMEKYHYVLPLGVWNRLMSPKLPPQWRRCVLLSSRQSTMLHPSRLNNACQAIAVRSHQIPSDPIFSKVNVGK